MHYLLETPEIGLLSAMFVILLGLTRQPVRSRALNARRKSSTMDVGVVSLSREILKCLLTPMFGHRSPPRVENHRGPRQPSNSL